MASRATPFSSLSSGPGDPGLKGEELTEEEKKELEAKKKAEEAAELHRVTMHTMGHIDQFNGDVGVVYLNALRKEAMAMAQGKSTMMGNRTFGLMMGTDGEGNYSFTKHRKSGKSN